MAYGQIRSSSGRVLNLTPLGWVNNEGVNLNAPTSLSAFIGSQPYNPNQPDGPMNDSNLSLADLVSPDFDRRNPIDYMGRKGFHQADGRILDPDGKLIADTMGVQKKQAQEAAEDRVLKQMQMQAQIAELMASAKEKNAKATQDPTMPKLSPGETYNKATGEVEPVPGSKTYVAQADKHATDLDAMRGIEQGATNAQKKIAALLDPANRSGFESNFGGFNALLTQYLPTDQTHDARGRLESLKSDLKMAGLNAIRSGGSIGAMTEKEWPIVQDMIGKLTPTLSEKEAQAQLENIAAYIGGLQKRAQSKYQTEWGNTVHARRAQDNSPAGNAGPKLGAVVDGYVYTGGDPKSPSSWKAVK